MLGGAGEGAFNAAMFNLSKLEFTQEMLLNFYVVGVSQLSAAVGRSSSPNPDFLIEVFRQVARAELRIIDEHPECELPVVAVVPEFLTTNPAGNIRGVREVIGEFFVKHRLRDHLFLLEEIFSQRGTLPKLDSKGL